jgi:hypothetical protein
MKNLLHRRGAEVAEERREIVESSWFLVLSSWLGCAAIFNLDEVILKTSASLRDLCASAVKN